MFKRLTSLIFFVGLLFGQAHAGPWIDSGDARLRHHIQVLADQGIITSPVTTWPLMWSSISADLNRTKISSLNETTLWSLKYVQFIYRQESRSINFNASASIRGDVNPLTTFGEKLREKDLLGAEIDWVGESFAARLTGSYTDDPLDGDTLRVDGSYIAVTLGNWALSAGAVDKWWGPGWNNSLVLSHNARPVPGLTLQRNQSLAFETMWLSWLGPWQFVAFGGQLESERYNPDAKLLGARFSFKPSYNWELGLSCTAQRDGDGRPQDWDGFQSLVQGEENSGGIAADVSNKSGNQFTGIDAKYSFGWHQYHNAVYLQLINEDKSGVLPSRRIWLGGIETTFLAGNAQHRIVVELLDTTVDSYNEIRQNDTYEQGIVQSGYRYKGRVIGAATDADTRELSLSGYHYFSNGHQLNWSAAYLQINRDNINAASVSSTFGTAVDTTYLKISYALPLNKRWMAEVGLNFSSETIIYNNESLGDGGHLTLKYKY